MEKNEYSNCNYCQFFLRFTQNEKVDLSTRLQNYNIHNPYIGACVFNGVSNERLSLPIIRALIQAPVQNCLFRTKGFYKEHTGIKCPKCKTGEIVLLRFTKTFSFPTLFFGCTGYPQCDFSSARISLGQKCRFCNHTLQFCVIDNQLYCECPHCKRKVLSPYLLGSWPALLPDRKQCSHRDNVTQCVRCQKSIKLKKDLIALEIEEILHNTQTIGIPTSIYNRERAMEIPPVVEGNPQHFYEEGWEEFEEMQQEYIQEREEFLDNMDRLNETGWFYADED